MYSYQLKEWRTQTYKVAKGEWINAVVWYERSANRITWFRRYFGYKIIYLPQRLIVKSNITPLSPCKDGRACHSAVARVCWWEPWGARRPQWTWSRSEECRWESKPRKTTCHLPTMASRDHSLCTQNRNVVFHLFQRYFRNILVKF